MVAEIKMDEMNKNGYWNSQQPPPVYSGSLYCALIKIEWNIIESEKWMIKIQDIPRVDEVFLFEEYNQGRPPVKTAYLRSKCLYTEKEYIRKEKLQV